MNVSAKLLCRASPILNKEVIFIITENLQDIDYADFEAVLDVILPLTDNARTQTEVNTVMQQMKQAAIQKQQMHEFSNTVRRLRRFIEEDTGFQFIDFNAAGLVLRWQYDLTDFQNTEDPFREVFEQPTAFKQKRALELIAAEAQQAGYKGFKSMYTAYVQERRAMNEQPNANLPVHATEFPEQPLELDAGDWICDASGVYRTGINGFEYACHHPIMPVKRLVNIDTWEEKLEIAFYRGRGWRKITASKRTLFDSSKIIELAAYGAAVTSKTAKTLADFLCHVEGINYDRIPQQDSISHIGWMQDGGFSPYVQDIAFDGDASYGEIFRSIRQEGDFGTWKQAAIRCRRESVTAQVMLAASFASVLISRIGALPFFVHLWGGESGTGKSVALMLAASVWGNPEIGKYPQTFNATQVGHEKTAAFLGNIPMCIDELQLSKDSHGRSKFDVYQLAQGVGRTRGNKAGGVDKTPTWSLCILTTGESPIVSESAGAGAVNRVIDIECRASEKVIRDGIGTCRVIRSHYGHAGRRFVESLSEERITQAQEMYQQYFGELAQGETTEKQAMAAALLLTADALADTLIFGTGQHLTTAQISAFLKSKASVSVGERGYSYMCDWVAMNANKFQSENKGEIYGTIEGDYAYVNQSVFRSACRDAGFDDRALLSWLKSEGLILTRGRNNTRGKRINGVNVECIAMKMKDCDSYDGDEYNCLL